MEEDYKYLKDSIMFICNIDNNMHKTTKIKVPLR